MELIADLLPPGPGKWTYEDYARLPDDGNRYEVLDGELYVSPSPRTRHQAVSRSLEFLLHAHVSGQGLGEVFDAPIDVIFGPKMVAVPDIVFVAAARKSIITERAIEGAPDLIVEILSPWSVRQDRVEKAALYARHGVRHYWIADPEACSLETFVLAGQRYRPTGTYQGASKLRSEPFPDLEIDLGLVWP
jgi:Uma2 family endonuclease